MTKSLGKVLITAKSFLISPEPMKILREAGCEAEYKDAVFPVNEGRLIEQVRKIDALVFGMEPVTRRLLDAAPNLKIIARPGVGYDTVDLAAASAKRVVVTIAPENNESVADFAFGLLLASARGIVKAIGNCRERRWERVTGAEVWNKTIAVVGLGRIGKGVAKRARGFDMRVLAVENCRDEQFAAQHGVEFVSLEEALRQADFVSLHTPLTPETANLMNVRTLAMMKPGSYLINTARGGLIDEEALVEAVRCEHLAGAAVDVLKEQGANSSSPLIGVPGILVTPHMATYSREAQERVAISVAHSVVAALKGERPPYVVNPEIYTPAVKQ
jgi:D-3-phosphoglycerate dehydrogenase